ncbi:unnamed protein product, partial [Polarella glacialis]
DFCRDAGFNVRKADMVGSGVAVVDFVEPRSARDAAKELHGRDVDGHRISAHEDGRPPFGGKGGRRDNQEEHRSHGPAGGDRGYQRRANE